MKQCPTCGVEVQPDWTLCPSCLSKLPSSSATTPATEQQSSESVTPDSGGGFPGPNPVPRQTALPAADVPAPDPKPDEAPAAAKPPEKRDLKHTLTNPVLLGLVGALVIFLVLGAMLPGGLSDLIGGKSADVRPVASLTPAVTATPSPAAANTVVPLTPVNLTANMTAVPQTTMANISTPKPSLNVTVNQTPHVDHTLSPYLQNGGGGGGTWKYEPAYVGTLTNIETPGPIVTWTTPVTIPIMPTPTLQATVPTVPVVSPVNVTVAPVQTVTGATTLAVQGGHVTGPTAWAGTGNYASDLFNLSSGVVKLSVTADQAAVVKVMDTTGRTIGSTSAGPQPGSNAIPISATGMYLVDVNSTGTWTVTVSVLSTGTTVPVQTVIPVTTTQTT